MNNLLLEADLPSTIKSSSWAYLKLYQMNAQIKKIWIELMLINYFYKLNLEIYIT